MSNTENNGIFAEVARQWLEKASITIKTSTFNRYEQIVRTVLNPIFGKTFSNQISSEQFGEFSKKLNENYEYGTASLIIKVFTRILKHAGVQKIPSVAELLQNEKSVKNINTLSLAECVRFNNYLCNHFCLKNLGILIALNCGLRLGEVCGLRWSDVNLQIKSVRISSSMQRVRTEAGDKSTEVLVWTPKTANSVRQVPVSGFIYRIIKTISKGITDQNAFILTGEMEHFIEPRALERHFATLCNKVLNRKLKFHDLRHTFATVAIDSGIDVKTVSEMLGHSNIYTTLNFYRSVTLEDKRKAIAKLERKMTRTT